MQPVTVTLLLAAVDHRWNFCQLAERLWFSSSTLMAGFSLATSLAISVDRLLALSLGIRYRQVVTTRGARLFIALFLLFSITNYVTELLYSVPFLVYSASIWALCLITSVVVMREITYKLRLSRKVS